MKVLIVSQVFHPDASASGQIAADLAADLVQAGHQVTAIAASGAYTGGGRLPSRETWCGVKIVRVGGTSFGKGTMLGRLADYATFMVLSLTTSLAMARHDVVIGTTVPPLIATVGVALHKLKGTRFVYWVQDVYPDLAVALGVLSARSLPAWCFERISRATLRNADDVVVIGDAMAERIRAKGVASSKLHVIPNWADGTNIRPVPHAENTFRRNHGLEGKRVVLYSGNMGRGHDLTTLLEAARRMRSEPDLVFAFIGDGAKRPLVEQAAAELATIRLFPYQRRQDLAESLSAGDVHAVTLDARSLGLMEPSKLYGIMAAGRSALFIGPPKSEVAKTVVREEIGEVVANGDVEGAVAALKRLLAAAPSIGERAHLVFERTYERRHRTGQFAMLLERLAIPWVRR